MVQPTSLRRGETLLSVCPVCPVGGGYQLLLRSARLVPRGMEFRCWGDEASWGPLHSFIPSCPASPARLFSTPQHPPSPHPTPTLPPQDLCLAVLSTHEHVLPAPLIPPPPTSKLRPDSSPPGFCSPRAGVGQRFPQGPSRNYFTLLEPGGLMGNCPTGYKSSCNQYEPVQPYFQ